MFFFVSSVASCRNASSLSLMFNLRKTVIGAVALALVQIAAAAGLSDADVERIGKRIWQNECGGSVSGLTSWNSGEEFASLGIGHFIWYPAGETGPFEESFPPLVDWLRRSGAQVPQWLL